MNEKKLYLMYPMETGTIAPEIYGHFTELIGGVFYDGLWVGRDSEISNIHGFRKEMIEKLRDIKPAVLRWPGGCFAETYDWRDGIGEDRPVRPGWWKNHDGRYERNEVGTHEFAELCELVGAKAYFAANLTSTTPQHIRDWMDYCLSPRGSTTLALEREKNGHPEPFDIPFWGVGNENWGGGGHMRPQYYADECRKYAELMHNMAPNAELYMCGTDGDKYEWSHGVLPVIGNYYTGRRPITGYAMHYYCAQGTDQLHFGKEGWDGILASANRMDEVIRRNWNILCGYGMEKHIKLIVDEWGAWHKDGTGPSKGYNLFEEQNTMVDAMVAALTLNIFNNHCDKVRMANIAQLANNIQSLFLSAGEQCIVTPTYHVFHMFREHQGATAIQTVVTDNQCLSDSVSVSASVKDGKTLLTLGNLSYERDAVLTLEAVGAALPAAAEGTLLYCDDPTSHNTFEAPETVTPTAVTVDLTKPVTVPKTGILTLRF